jgi:hypothetical protein
MGFRFSIIVPTCGRRSLGHALHSIQEQTLVTGDEVLLITDGPLPQAADLFRRSGLPGQCLGTEATRDLGASQRNRGMDLAVGDYLLFLDDDDTFAAGAFAAVRSALREAPGRPHLFRMRYAASGHVLWADQRLILGNVGTPMIVVPNRQQLRRWDRRHGHDYRFVAGNLPLWPPECLVWREEIIAIVRPQGGAPPAYDQPSLPPAAARRPEDCPFRGRPGGEERGADVACCRLLQQLLGAEDPRWCEVRRDACTACSADYTPSAIDINNVLASLVYGRADEILARGGVAGCEADRAFGLRTWAEVNLRFACLPESSTSVPRREVGPCCYLGPEIGFRVQAAARGHSRLPVFECRHPAHRETTLGACHRCRDWADRPGTAPVPVERLVPPPAPRRGPKVRRWAVGVTSAPRRRPTLDWCLDSLIRAGWETPRLFIDSAVTIGERFAGLPVSLREGKLGAWPNYYLTLVELLMREPEADAFLLVQDDVVLFDRQNLREYLEEALWPADPVGAVSLFCSSAYTRTEPGWYAPEDAWVWGAQAFVFPRESAKRFVADPLVLEHRWSYCHRGLANIDTVIGQWAARHGLPICYPSPSLAQHVGDTSTLWPEARIDGHRRADQFAGELE